MATLTRNQIAMPALPRETVAVPPLGGDVIVRGLLLRERLELSVEQRKDGNSFRRTAQMLARSVVDDQDQPLLSEAEWEAFGGLHPGAALDLFGVAYRLSGFNVEVVEKN